MSDPAVRPNSHPSVGRWLIGMGLLSAIVASVGLVISGSQYQPSTEGLPDAGPVVGWGLGVLRTIGLVLAIGTIGSLLFAVFLDPRTASGHVSPVGRRYLKGAAVFSGIWALTTLVTAVFTLSDILGISLSEALTPKVISTFAFDLTQLRSLLFVALLAAGIAIGCAFTFRLDLTAALLLLGAFAVGLPTLTGHAAGLGDHSLAILSAFLHAVFATVWIGGIVALIPLAWSMQPDLDLAARRFSRIAMVCLCVVLISGIANAYVNLAGWSDLLSTGYGRLVLGKVLLLVALAVAGTAMRSRILPSLSGPRVRLAFAKLASIEVGLMAVAVGLGIALSQTAATRHDVSTLSPAESVLGYPFPPPPNLNHILLGWRSDAAFVALVAVAAGLYLAGVIRLHRRGDKWPIGRTVCWLLGLVVVLWATNGGIAEYATVSVGYHMIEHMSLAMVAPIFLVLAGPMTLALRAIKPASDGQYGPRELLVSGLHSRVAEVVTHPVVVLVIYASGIYGLYFTSLFNSLMTSHIGHVAMAAHFLLSGYLLAWVAIGIDPTPRPLPYWGRLLLVLLAITLHSFFAIALSMATVPIGQPWFTIVRPPWLVDPLADSVTGGQIAWGVGEIPTAVMMTIIAVQWYRSDTREAKRRDRKVDRAGGDAELEAYNRYLARLAEKDREHQAKEEARYGDGTDVVDVTAANGDLREPGNSS